MVACAGGRNRKKIDTAQISAPASTHGLRLPKRDFERSDRKSRMSDVANASAARSSASMIEALRRNVLPIVRIAGEDVRWTMQERLAHYECPGVGVAVLEEGRVSWSAGYGHIERGLERLVE